MNQNLSLLPRNHNLRFTQPAARIVVDRGRFLAPTRQRGRRTMRRIINSTYISLDGVIEQPQTWPSGGVADDSAYTIQRDLLFSCDAVLMGRRTYEGFAPVWPTRSGDEVS